MARCSINGLYCVSSCLFVFSYFLKRHFELLRAWEKNLFHVLEMLISVLLFCLPEAVGRVRKFFHNVGPFPHASPLINVPE